MSMPRPRSLATVSPSDAAAICRGYRSAADEQRELDSAAEQAEARFRAEQARQSERLGEYIARQRSDEAAREWRLYR